MNWIEQIKSARRVSVPIIAINTPDPESTIRTVCEVVNGDAPKLEWDVVSGLSGRNNAGTAAVASVTGGEYDDTKGNPIECLVKAAKLPGESILFVHLAPRWWADSHSSGPYVQALWNLRDRFKRNHRMVILLGRHVELPQELQDDVIVIDEPLPDAQRLHEIVDKQHENAGLNVDGMLIEKAVEAVRGLSAFAAEQVTAMCLKRKGVDLDALWERKRQMIEQTPGLKVFRETQTFGQIGGCDVVKDFLRRIMQGNDRPNATVFVDEIEKSLGGSSGDTSGVSQDQLGTLLSYMQDHNCTGMIFVGPPGAAKSAVAKAAGHEGGVPTIQLDLGAAKGSLVGQSEQQIRNALKVITAVSNGRSLWIATCNSIGELPPELRRRFTLGTFFFDLPTSKERAVIWNIYRARYGLTEMDDPIMPHDNGWTGAEIRQCCEIAWRLECSLEEAAQFVVPVAISAAAQIKRLREQSDGRFLSASHPGVYRANREAVGARAVSLED